MISDKEHRMNIDSYYTSLGQPLEKHGHIRQDPDNVIDQPYHLRDICLQTKARNIMEIGFNAGHSADLFLSFDPRIRLTSFELGQLSATLYGKSFIDQKYPFRHNLIIGDSKSTVPGFFRENPRLKFDVIFIDGSHEFLDAFSDLFNCQSLAHQNTVVILDDTTSCPPSERESFISYVNSNLGDSHTLLEGFERWTSGPTAAWNKLVQEGLIEEINSYDYNYKYFPWKGQSWGRYANL